MANNLTVTGNLAITGSSVFTGTVDLAGGALNTDLVTNFNADLLDGAELSTDGTLADNSDTAVPTEKAVRNYADTKVSLGMTDEPAYQELGLTGISGAYNTGLSQETEYKIKLTIDAFEQTEYTITTPAETVTYTIMMALLDAECEYATWHIVGGDVRCTSKDIGPDSLVLIAAGSSSDLLAALSSTPDTPVGRDTSGDQTITGVKTFSGGIVGDLTGNVTGNVTGDLTGKADEADGIVETQASLTIKTKMIIIGDWDMDTTVSINVAHGFADVSLIRFVDASIRDDDGYIHPLCLGGSVSVLNGTNLILIRDDTGHFNTTDFNRTGYNRGWIKFEYVE